MSSWGTSVERLIENNSFDELVSRIVDRPSFDTSGMTDGEAIQEVEEDKVAYDAAVNFLYDHIDQLLVIFANSSNAAQKLQLVTCFGLLKHPDSIESLLNVAVNDQNEHIRETALSILTEIDASELEKGGLWIENTGTEVLLLDYLARSKGSLRERLLDLISNYSKRSLIRSCLREIGLQRCKIIGGICNKAIYKDFNSYFIGYDFKKSVVKNKIVEFFEDQLQEHVPKTADQRLINAQVLCNVCQYIQSVGFCIFDLSKTSKSDYPNANVMLELGIAFGFGIPTIILHRKNTKIISDLAGCLRVEYKKPSEIPSRLSEHDLTSVVKG